MKRNIVSIVCRYYSKCKIILCCFFLFSSQAKAQFVNIPDPSFQTWLSNNTGCTNGLGQLDTTCASVLNDTILLCFNNTISNLDGIQYFKRLRYLDCSYNPLDSLINLPSSIRTLYCSNTNIQAIKALPDSLVYLDCMNCYLPTLPPLPNSIAYINCRGNSMTVLPSLPANLTYLLCSYNSMDSLPPLPPHLDTLNCSLNHLIKLPPFPSSLRYLECAENHLTTLPYGRSINYIDCNSNSILILPNYDSLQYLNCGINQLTRLPSFPETFQYLVCDNNNIDSIFNLPIGLQIMDCGFNPLKSLGNRLPDSLQSLMCYNDSLVELPPLSKGLTDLYCVHNLLSSLPELPDSMFDLNCSNNPNLHCLPKLSRITHLIFDSTAVTCLPNYGDVTSSSPTLSSLPLCTLNNINGCQVYTSVMEPDELSFAIYPNPAGSEIVIAVSKPGITVDVIDLSGREVLNTTALTTKCRLSLNLLAQGLYFVKLSDSLGKSEIKLLVKQ